MNMQSNTYLPDAIIQAEFNRKRRRGPTLVRWGMLLCLICFAQAALAEIVSVSFTGKVSNTFGNPFGLTACIDQQITGSIMYDTSIPDSNIFNPDVGAYFAPPPNGFSFSIGETAAQTEGIVSFQVINNAFGFDGINAFSSVQVGGSPGFGFGSFNFVDFTQTALSSKQLPLALSLASFSLRTANIFDPATGASMDFEIDAQLLPPSPLPVPFLYVPSGSTNSVLRYDETGCFADSFVASGSGGLRNPRAVILGPDGHIYVSQGTGNTDPIRRYDGITGEFIDNFARHSGVSPFGIAFGPDGHLYAASFSSNNVVRFNGSTGEFIGVFASGGGLTQPRGLGFGPDGDLYVSSVAPGAGKVIRYDGSTGKLKGAFATGVDPRGLVFGPDGHLYVASFGDNAVLRFDGKSGAFIDAFAEGGGLNGPVGLLFAPDGHLYVGSFNNHSVVRYDGKTGEPMDDFIPSRSGELNQPRLFAAIVEVEIEINPLSERRRVTNPGMLPIAILSSESFDATALDRSSVRFAGASARAGNSTEYICYEADVAGPDGRRDALNDLVCLFDASKLVIEPGSETVPLSGKSKFGDVYIRGEDNVMKLF